MRPACSQSQAWRTQTWHKFIAVEEEVVTGSSSEDHKYELPCQHCKLMTIKVMTKMEVFKRGMVKIKNKMFKIR